MLLRRPFCGGPIPGVACVEIIGPQYGALKSQYVEMECALLDVLALIVYRVMFVANCNVRLGHEA